MFELLAMYKENEIDMPTCSTSGPAAIPDGFVTWDEYSASVDAKYEKQRKEMVLEAEIADKARRKYAKKFPFVCPECRADLKRRHKKVCPECGYDSRKTDIIVGSIETREVPVDYEYSYEEALYGYKIYYVRKVTDVKLVVAEYGHQKYLPKWVPSYEVIGTSFEKDSEE